AGTVVYVLAMWNSGIIQGLMWRTYNASGTLAYSFVDSLVAMHPYYIARAFGGLLFLIGALVGCYNIWMTVRTPEEAAAEPADVPEPTAAGQPGPVPRPPSEIPWSDSTTGSSPTRSASPS